MEDRNSGHRQNCSSSYPAEVAVTANFSERLEKAKGNQTRSVIMKKPAVVLATLFVAGNVYSQGSDHERHVGQPGKADSRGQSVGVRGEGQATGITTYGVTEAGQPGKAQNRGQIVRRGHDSDVGS